MNPPPRLYLTDQQAQSYKIVAEHLRGRLSKAHVAIFALGTAVVILVAVLIAVVS
ncbi:MAG: hypothetical protein COB08_019420 [Rhodobacteraceae bacterium]|nr:hypothetical protein [Paracoccaceae bacterium]